MSKSMVSHFKLNTISVFGCFHVTSILDVEKVLNILYIEKRPILLCIAIYAVPMFNLKFHGVEL